jgi:hypothetical protein
MKGDDHEVLQMKEGDPETVLEFQTKDCTQGTINGPGLIVPRTKVLRTEQARALE